MYGYFPYICINKLTITMSTTTSDTARFDARLPKEQKLLFEKAALLGGYRNLTDFIFAAAQDKAKEIIKERELVIASERDSQVFFDAITNPEKPAQTLKKALADYKSFVAKS
ncbi:hypothetical protein SDC9_45637 [bioreactor metagenome]|uniref:DUF1778 domain-containing protein n=1 Tax=bioreactor metagenome TaxID=1076179 RepID=A0A644W6N5_9ZZZZ